MRRFLKITACFLLVASTHSVMAGIPDVTVEQAVGQTDPSTTSPIVFTVVFTEEVTGFDASDLDFGGSSIGGTLVGAISSIDNITFTVNVSGMTSSGTVQLSIPAAAAESTATSDDNNASTSLDNSVVFHATPTVTVSEAPGQADPTSDIELNIRAVFSEPVSGFDNTDVTLGGSASGPYTILVASVNSTTYDIAVTGMTTEGTVTLTVDAMAATADTGGQPNLESNTASITFESPAPTVTINQAGGQVDPANSTNIDFSVSFSAPVTGFNNFGTDINISGGATGVSGSISPNSSTNYTVSIVGIDPGQDVDVTLTIPSGAAQRIDGLQTDNVASTSTDNTVRYDDIAPTLSSLNPADNSVDIALTLSSIIITFNEDISLKSGGASNDNDRIRVRENNTDILDIDKTDIGLFYVSNNIATIDISGATFGSDTEYNIRIGNDVFEDLAGNDYAGINNNNDWSFTTIGLGVNGPDITLCTGADFIEIGEISINEASNDDFSSGAGQSLILTIPSGFEFQPGIGNISVTGTDISNGSFAVSSSNIVVFYDIDGSPNGADEISITGIRARPTGGPTTGDILRTGGDAIQNGNSIADAESHGTLTSANGDLTFSNDATANTICAGESVQFTASATGASNYELFIDGITAGSNGTGTFSGISSITDGQEVSIIATGGSCTESASVIFTVNDLPVVDAGSPQTVCSGELLTLGGTPTLTDATGATPYIYNWTGSVIPAGEETQPNPQFNAPDPGVSDQVFNYTVSVTDANGCVSATDNVNITVNNISEAVNITQPGQTTFGVNDNPVDLEGLPSGGSFSGPGVTLLGDNSYEFDPEAAGTDNSPHTIFYTTILSNGCEKTISQNLTVTANTSRINNLSLNYCDNEGLAGPLTLTPDFQAQVESYINYWNTTLVPFFGYSPLAPFDPADPNLKMTNGGTGIEIISSDYFFNPQNYTKQCSNCDYAFVGVYLKFLNSAFTVPIGEPEFIYSSQRVDVNPIPDAFFTGLNSDLSNTSNFCRVDEEYILTGSLPEGVWEIGFEGNNFQSATVGGVNGLSSSDGTQAIFNPGNVSQSGNWTIRYSSDPGTLGSSNQACEGVDIKNINVNGLPTISFNNGASEIEEDEEFCYDSPNEIIIGNSPPGGIINFIGLGVIYTSGNQAEFDPSLAIDAFESNNNTVVTTPQTFQITFSFTNANECTNTVVRNVTVFPPPATSFTVNKSDLCYNDPTEVITPNQPQGEFYLSYPDGSSELVAINQSYNFDPSVSFDEAVNRGHNPLDAASFELEWRVSQEIDGGNKTCFNSQFETFIVTPLETVTMAGIQDGATFCTNEEDIEITLSPINDQSIFEIDGSSTAISSEGIVIFSPSFRGPDTYTFVYTVTTGNGCESSITKTIEVLPSPVASFPVTEYCEGDVISFDAEPDANAVEYEWNFGDNSPIEFGQSVSHKYATTGAFTAQLTLRAAEINGVVCSSTTTQVVDVGVFPNANFTFNNVCEGENTAFQPSADISIESFTWDFDDGSPTTSTDSHLFPQVGNYDVELIASTANNCQDTVVRRVAILPNSTNGPETPYSMADIDGGAGGWAARDGNENLNSIWAFGIPSDSIINSDLTAWVTNLDGPYNPNENAFVLSPCFDLSAFDRPIVSIDFWSDTQRESDGAVFQYSVDGGTSWQTLGSVQNGVSTGLNWYNQSGITGNPGGQQLFGWSRAGDSTWTRARHALDVIPPPRDNVRFRMAFGSNGDTELEGFAFRNVRIEDRNKIVLLEHFTNEATPTPADNYVRAFGSSSNEVVKLEYRTNFPEDDPINQRNSSDNNSRAAYYGVSSSPTSFLDGDTEEGLISSGWGDLSFSRKTLATSPFELTASNSVNGELLEIEVGIESTSTLEDDNTVAHVVIAEKDAASNNFIYQLRKMLPDAAGSKLKDGEIIEIGETFTVSLSTLISDNLNPDLVGIIIFLQNEDTKEVYQSFLLENLELPPIVTSSETFDEEIIEVYPNPANKSFTITFKRNENSAVHIYDSFGKLIYSKENETGVSSNIINTSSFASGLYHVQIKSGEEIVQKRLMVTHSD